MRQRHLAGAGDAAAARQGRIGDRMVRRTERPLGHQSGMGAEQSTDGINFCDIQRLFQSQRRQDRRNAAGQHRLTGTGRADHHDVMAARRRDFQGAFDMFLALDLAKVQLICA